MSSSNDSSEINSADQGKSIQSLWEYLKKTDVFQEFESNIAKDKFQEFNLDDLENNVPSKLDKAIVWNNYLAPALTFSQTMEQRSSAIDQDSTNLVTTVSIDQQELASLWRESRMNEKPGRYQVQPFELNSQKISAELTWEYELHAGEVFTNDEGELILNPITGKLLLAFSTTTLAGLSLTLTLPEAVTAHNQLVPGLRYFEWTSPTIELAPGEPLTIGLDFPLDHLMASGQMLWHIKEQPRMTGEIELYWKDVNTLYSLFMVIKQVQSRATKALGYKNKGSVEMNNDKNLPQEEIPSLGQVELPDYGVTFRILCKPYDRSHVELVLYLQSQNETITKDLSFEIELVDAEGQPLRYSDGKLVLDSTEKKNILKSDETLAVIIEKSLWAQDSSFKISIKLLAS